MKFLDFAWLVSRDLLRDQGFGDNVSENAPILDSMATRVSQLDCISEYYQANAKNGFVAMGFAF